MEFIRPLCLLLYLFAYILSAMPTAYWVARILGVDIRTQKGHRHSASYMWQSVSKRGALLVFLLDLLKGLIPCAIALSLAVPSEVIALIGLTSVIGHCFSPFLWFLGGHGAVTMAGALLIIYWPAALAMLIVNCLLFILGLNPNFASILSSLVGAVAVFLAVPNRVIWSLVFLMVVVILFRHRRSTLSAN